MHTLYDVPAPAKLNLFLHVTGRRPDGYHLLQSVFMLIDWCDVLHFELRPGGGISRQDLGASLPAEDLILRAARALQQATGCTQGVHIGVHKHIPAQAGLGGGSSDAASTLLALNRLWRLGLTRSQLARMGLALGADVPFFLHGRNAWVQGIGEDIQAIDLPTARFAVVKPPQGLETRAIFSAPDLPRDSKHAIVADFVADPYGFGRNDLQAVAQRLCPSVSQALMWFEQLGLPARMTGSGSAVFARVPQAHDALGALGLGAQALDSQKPGEQMQKWQVRLCNNLGLHPLYGWASGED